MVTSWKIAFSANNVTATAWGSKTSYEYVSKCATLYLLCHTNGTVYMTVIGDDDHDILTFEFGLYSSRATFTRWGPTIVSYRVPGRGLFLFMPSSQCMERFEKSCDDLLPSCGHTPVSAPTLEDFIDLGIVKGPKIVGEFLTEEPLPSIHSETVDGTQAGVEDSFGDAFTEDEDEDYEGSDLFSVSDISSVGSDLDPEDIALLGDVFETVDDFIENDPPFLMDMNYVWFE